MKFNIQTFIRRTFCTARQPKYEIPDQYHNSFFLANASLLEIVNYYIHASYKAIFPELVTNVQKQLNCSSEDAAFKLRNCINCLEKCDVTFDLNLPLLRPNGFYSIVRANRTYHGLMFFDKCLGGMRFDSEISRHNSHGFAVQQCYRNALFGINMGGASGGFQISPYVLDSKEMSELIGHYMNRIPKIEGLIDIIEPDFGCSKTEMDIFHNYQKEVPYILTMGKSVEKGGFEDYVKSSGKCVVQSIRKFLENEEILKKLETTRDLTDKTYILHGFGKVGKAVGDQMAQAGAKCVGVREHDCVLYEPGGIHVKALYKHIVKFGTMRSFSSKCHEYDLDSIFNQPCDILFLNALERSVSCAIADKIQAKIIVEVANFAVTSPAYRVLAGKSKLVIPGILAGAGPSLMSYYELESSSKDSKLDPKNIQDLFNTSLQTAINDIIEIETQQKLNFNFVQAAYIRAVRNYFKKVIKSRLFQEKTNEKLIGMQC